MSDDTKIDISYDAINPMAAFYELGTHRHVTAEFCYKTGATLRALFAQRDALLAERERLREEYKELTNFAMEAAEWATQVSRREDLPKGIRTAASGVAKGLTNSMVAALQTQEEVK